MKVEIFLSLFIHWLLAMLMLSSTLTRWIRLVVFRFQFLLHFLIYLDRPTDRMKQIKNGCERIIPLWVWWSTADVVNLTVNSNPLYENDSQMNVYEKSILRNQQQRSVITLNIFLYYDNGFYFVFIQLNIHAQLLPKYWAWPYAWENDTSSSVFVWRVCVCWCVGVRTLAFLFFPHQIWKNQLIASPDGMPFGNTMH